MLYSTVSTTIDDKERRNGNERAWYQQGVPGRKWDRFIGECRAADPGCPGITFTSSNSTTLPAVRWTVPAIPIIYGEVFVYFGETAPVNDIDSITVGQHREIAAHETLKMWIKAITHEKMVVTRLY